MERRDLIELTIKLYKVTLFFPKKEPLRYKIRETANNILKNYIFWKHLSDPKEQDSFFITEEIKKDVEVMDSYLEVAKWQNWVPFFDILNIKNEYDKIKDSFPRQETIKFEPIKETPEPNPIETVEIEKPVIIEPKKELTDRKKKILDVLKKKEMVQVWEINKILPNVSKRTLRRDFEQLLKDGYVQRIGETNKTYYKLA